jgi:hypothetical protein
MEKEAKLSMMALLTFLLVIYFISLANQRPVSKRNMDSRAFVQCATCTGVTWSHPQKAYFGRRRALKVLSSEMDPAEISFI